MRSSTGFVYYARAPVPFGPIKIGFSTDPWQRMQLVCRQRDWMMDGVLLAYHEGTRQDEATEHQRFAMARLWQLGEWFKPTRLLLDYIAGLPDPSPIDPQDTVTDSPQPQQRQQREQSTLPVPLPVPLPMARASRRGLPVLRAPTRERVRELRAAGLTALKADKDQYLHRFGCWEQLPEPLPEILQTPPVISMLRCESALDDLSAWAAHVAMMDALFGDAPEGVSGG